MPSYQLNHSLTLLLRLVLSVCLPACLGFPNSRSAGATTSSGDLHFKKGDKLKFQLVSAAFCLSQRG